jgi:hypothetical protein
MYTASEAKALFNRIGRQDWDAIAEMLREGYGLDTLTLDTATVLLNAGIHGGKKLLLSRAAGVVCTLPDAVGSGVEFKFFVLTTVTSNAYAIAVSRAADTMQGGVAVASDIAGVNAPTVAASDTLSMNGTTTGGLIGSQVNLKDIAPNIWEVNGFLKSSGVEATPFSAAVP